MLKETNHTTPTLFDHSYYNTVPLEGKDLGEAREKTKLQDELILEFFTRNSGKEFSPCQAWTILQETNNLLLTSVRRSITSMTETPNNPGGVLVQTGNKIIGIHGREVNTWRLK